MLLLQQSFALHDARFGLGVEHKGQLTQGHQLPVPRASLAAVLLILHPCTVSSLSTTMSLLYEFMQ